MTLRRPSVCTFMDVPELSVPDIRDYRRINAELIQLLDQGHPRVRLAGVAGQRLLASGLRGTWRAVVEVEGQAGPELAADLEAPELIVVGRGGAADGAGRGLKAGRLAILGPVGAGVAAGLDGGTVLVAGPAGDRAGLRMTGGVLVLLGSVGRLAGDRQAGGRLLAFEGRLGPHPGRGRQGGEFRLVPLPGSAPDLGALRVVREAVAGFGSEVEGADLGGLDLGGPGDPSGR